MPDDTPRAPPQPRAPAGDARFLMLLDTLPFAAFVVPSSVGPGGGQAAYYNACFVAYVGFTPGPAHADRAGLLHPDDRPALAAARAAGTQADADYVIEARFRRHDGEYRWHRIHNKPVLEDGRRTAYLGTVIDIHDQRAATQLLEQRVGQRTAELADANARLARQEARTRELYDRTPMALHSSSAQGLLLDVNDTWLQLFGATRDQVLGRPPTDFMTEASAALFQQRAWPEMLASGGAARVMDYRFVDAGGRVFDGRLSARGVFDDDGNLVRTWAAIADVTAEKQAGLALHQAQRMDAIGQLTAGIAHDFNNLLTAILGSLELAARPTQREDVRLRLIEAAHSAGQRGARLTAQLLAFSRQQRIVAEPVELNALLQAMTPMLASTAGEGVQLSVACEPGLPLALADATQMELAVLNLVINARDAMDAAGHIAVTTMRVAHDGPMAPEEPEAGEYLAIEVRDGGPGIPDDVRARMFEPFYTTKGVGRGSGLGLAQVLGIAKQLGGGVVVRSAPGQGTAVRVLVPFAAGAPAPAPPGPALPPRAAAPATILLVDDDPAVRATAFMLLTDAGHRVQEADSAAAALDALDSGGAFDLLLADIAMPGGSGVELAEAVRARRPGLPTLLMTGYADEGVLSPAAWAEVLRKPFDTAELLAAVARALHG